MSHSDIAGVIEIASNAIYFKISQLQNGKIMPLEYLEYPLSLGKDSFSKGTIEFSKADKLCSILNNFLKLAADYKIKKIKSVATTALRDASNRDYILEQIRVKTGLEIEVLDDNEEKIYIYKEMIREILLKKYSPDKDILFAYIGSGSLGVALYRNENIIFSQNILIGTLKLSEILGNIKDCNSLYLLIDEYLSSFTHMLKKILPSQKIDYFMVSGREISLIKSFCEFSYDESSITISKDSFMKFYNEIKLLTPEQIFYKYNISEEKAEILLPSMGIYKSLLNFTNSDKLISPKGVLLHSILHEILLPDSKSVLDEIIDKSIVSSSKTIAERYLYDEKHAEIVEKISLKIFDKLKKIHGLGKRERILLHTAAILHDIGKYLNIKNHYKHSYYIIMATDILGLNNIETEIVANIAIYHSRKLPSSDTSSYKFLSYQQKVIISKLLAILRLADALDRSHAQKIDSIEVKLKDNELFIIVDSNKNILIDEWTFKEKSSFFKEVFGINAYLKKKG